MTAIKKSVPYVLLVSLALNLVLIGFILGEKRVFLGGPVPPATFRYIIQSLPDDMRKNLKQGMKSEFSNAERSNKMNQLFGNLLVESLSTGEFNKERFDTAFSNLEIIMLQVHGSMVNRLMNIFEQMTPEQRIEFAQQLKEKLKDDSS